MNLGPKINMFLLSGSDRQWSHLPVLERQIRQLLIKKRSLRAQKPGHDNRDFRLLRHTQKHIHTSPRINCDQKLERRRSLTQTAVRISVEGLQSNFSPSYGSNSNQSYYPSTRLSWSHQTLLIKHEKQSPISLSLFFFFSPSQFVTCHISFWCRVLS